MGSFDLNIGTKILEHLLISDAIKEIISNAIDEHLLHNITKDIKIGKHEKYWYIRDYALGIEPTDFIIQINSKKSNNYNLIGKFGYGLKDALGILNTKEITVKIITKKWIYNMAMKQRNESDKQTLHIIYVKNTTIEIDENIGTEFRLYDLKKSDIDEAKHNFIYFIKPELLISQNNISIFIGDDDIQNIYINGVKIVSNTGYHYSYNLNNNEKFQKSFNRDRKDVDKKIMEKYLKQELVKINLFNNNKPINNTFYDKIVEILSFDTAKKLQEFNSKQILCSYIIQINDLEKYMFIGKTEKTKKYDEAIAKCDYNCQKFILGNSIKTKFSISNIKELYNIDKVYKKNDSNKKEIHTILSHVMKIDKEQDTIRKKVSTMIDKIKKLEVNINEDLEKKLLNITIDDNLDKNEYDFEQDLLICQNMSDKKLAGIIFEYVIKNIDDNQKEPIYNKLGEMLINHSKSWFSW